MVPAYTRGCTLCTTLTAVPLPPNTGLLRLHSPLKSQLHCGNLALLLKLIVLILLL